MFSEDASEDTKELFFSSTWLGLLPRPEEKRIDDRVKMFRVESPDWILIWAPGEEGGMEEHIELYEAGVAADEAVELAARRPLVVASLKDAIASWIDATHRDRRAWSSGEGTLELLRELGYVGD